MAFRNTIPKDVQGQVLDKVREISWHVNPRIWIALKWLSTYFSIRPWEMVRIKEGDIRVQNGVGYFIITDPKEKEPKIVPMIDEDVELVQSLPRSFPELLFLDILRASAAVRSFPVWPKVSL